ncbi:hypothetical protein ABG862_02760 [Bacteroides xylanisolvens]|uniref:hypothetical protein n=1 Tax=Bacteroides TaxID=816 RepID=UPI00325B97EC
MNTTALQKKRKSIDLSVNALQKLSAMAASQGQSLKVFIENILETKAESSDVVYTNPSPSGDPWFDDPENIASLNRGIEDAKQGRSKYYTMDEIRTLLGA